MSKAPDKIYIDDYSGFSTVPLKNDSAEYIRKDALLEWLKERGYEDVDRISIETLIDKINSL